MRGGGTRRKKRTVIVLAVGIVLSVATAWTVGFYTTFRSGLFTGMIVLLAVIGLVILGNPPKTRGRGGADRIDFGK